MATRKRAAKKPVKKIARKRRTVANPFPTKLEARFIEAKVVFDAAKAAGWSDEYALAFAMDRASYPDWIVPADDPIKRPDWDDEDDD